jgi:hypothetical protein
MKYKENTSQQVLMTSVHPTMESWEIWLKEMVDIIEFYKVHNEIPYKQQSAIIRSANASGVTCCCSPCIIWSTMVRLLLCPCYCLVGKPLTNNGCTDLSDECVEKSYKGVYERAMARKMPPIDQFGPIGLLALQKLSSEIMTLLGVTKCSIQHYDLANALFGNTLTQHCYPITVIDLLSKIHVSLL